MRIKEVIGGYDCEYKGDVNAEITDVTCDSRNVTEGSMFFCISGYKSDGHDYAVGAVEKGAAALVVTRYLDVDIPQILVKDDREAMAVLSSNFFGKPQELMKIVGITGTNGKTTTTYLCADIAKILGKRVGIIGTICNYIIDEEIKTSNTTPESVELFRLLRRMADRGVEVVFMEVSSHSLCLKRVFGISFDIGVFTNLTQDHLDFHKTMEEYAKAKGKLLENSKLSIINGDDNWSDTLKKHCSNEIITYGLDSKNDAYAYGVQAYSSKNTFKLKILGEELDITIGIPGQFSVYNAVCAAVICKKLGYSNRAIEQGLLSTKGVDGRCQVLKDKPYTIILDYAHTPDGLKNILSTFKGFGRIVCLFGCGGDRDPVKRPIMGEIAGNNSDFVILTSDNPRFEEPMSIIKMAEKGLKKTGAEYTVIEDRRQAIKYAIANAKSGDIIILAGKGHETYQDIKGVKHDFDEKKIVSELLG